MDKNRKTTSYSSSSKLFKSSSLPFHIGTRRLILNKLSRFLCSIIDLLTLIQQIILHSLLLGIAWTVLPCRHFEKLLLRSVHLHQLDPVSHARKNRAAWGVLDENVACCALELADLAFEVLVTYAQISGDCKNLKIVVLVFDVFLVDWVHDRTTHCVYVDFALLGHFTHGLELGGWTLF